MPSRSLARHPAVRRGGKPPFQVGSEGGTASPSPEAMCSNARIAIYTAQPSPLLSPLAGRLVPPLYPPIYGSLFAEGLTPLRRATSA
jgi:hypothetical protein